MAHTVNKDERLTSHQTIVYIKGISMNAKDRFFFQQASAVQETQRKLAEKRPFFKVAILNLTDNDLESICQACLNFEDYNLATGFSEVREILDLGELNNKLEKDKKYLLETYRKSIATSLVENKLPEVVVWFVINQKGAKV